MPTQETSASMDQPETKRTFCRVCEPSCGLIATLEHGEIKSILPDKEHPVTKGFACHKGLAVLDIHKDPDRLRWPLRKNGDTFERISWETAAATVGEQLRGLQARYGNNALGIYSGNPLAFNSTAGPAISSFVSAIGSRRNFSSGTQDCANKFAASEAVFGSSTIHPVPDIQETDLMLILGANPRVSHMSFVSIADPVAELRAAKKRGARLIFVDPRQNESVTGLGELRQVKPDSDVYLLSAMLAHCFQEGLIDQAATRAHGENIGALEAFVTQYPAERVASVVGLTAGEIRTLASDFAAADKASIYMSTGVNMGRQGAVAYWLIYMLSLVTGNLGRAGGNRYANGFYPAAKAGATRGQPPRYQDSSFGKLRTVRGSLPGNLMADMILDDPDPIRGLIVISGNPLLSIGNSARMQAALEQLEFLVVIDIYPSATSDFADITLPATDMFERADINLAGLGLQHKPFVQFTEALVAPGFERKPEWEIMARLEQAYLNEPENDTELPDPFARLDHMLGASDTSISALSAALIPVKVLETTAPESLFESVIQTDTGLVDCCPETMAAARDRCDVIFKSLSAEATGQLKLISRRTNYMLNSWFHNVEQLKRPKHLDNPLYIHPSDAQSRQLQDGSTVKLFNEFGALTTRIAFDETLRPGVVAMTHGWGNQGQRMKTAAKHAGTNANVLLPSGPGSFEPFSNQSFMTGIAVDLQAAKPFAADIARRDT